MEKDNYFSSMLVKSLSLYTTSMQTYVSNVHQTTNMAEKCKRLGVCVFSHAHFRYDELEGLDFYVERTTGYTLLKISVIVVHCISMYLCNFSLLSVAKHSKAWYLCIYTSTVINIPVGIYLK